MTPKSLNQKSYEEVLRSKFAINKKDPWKFKTLRQKTLLKKYGRGL